MSHEVLAPLSLVSSGEDGTSGELFRRNLNLHLLLRVHCLHGCCNGQEHDVRRVSFTSRCCNGYDYITLHSCLAFQANSCAGIKIANKTVPTITLAQSDFDQNPLKRRYQTSCFRHAHSEKDMVSRIRDV